jgi:aminopeptidase N
MGRMSELTRDEAQNRARLLDVQRYEIDLDLTRGEEVFGSVSTVSFEVREDGADTFVEVRAAGVGPVTLDGVPVDATEVVDGRLPLRGLSRGAHVLRVEADMRYSRVGEGMHRFVDPADGEAYLYTQCCMAEAPSVFACFDQPDLKAVLAVSVTAPEGWTVLGNGIAEHVGGGRWVCAATPPISTYLMAVVAGPYHSVRSEHRGLPFGLHVRRSLAAHLDRDAEELLDITRRCFDRYHEKFDEPYPFDSYDQAFVPEFNAGAMENPGLVTFRDEFVFRSAVTETERMVRGMVVAHEMAHMWFGDLVTLRWWDDIWLNESFAEYMGYQTLAEATDFTDTWTDFAVARKSWGYDADQRSSTHPVAPDPGAVVDTAAARLNFDGISYAKGASALRQLVVWLGEESFLAGINAHFARHRFGNATLADFIESLAGASKERDVRAWADRWLRTTGVDTLSSQVTEAGDGWELTVTNGGSRPHRVAVGVYDRDADGGLVVRERFEVDGAPGAQSVRREGARPALALVNDGDLSYAKVRLDEVSLETVSRSLSSLPDALSRAVVWNTLRDMVRDGDLAPSAYVETMRAHLAEESDTAIMQGVLVFARRHVADRFLAGGERTAALEAISEVCRGVLARTADGVSPGLRLTAVRALADAATDPAELLAWRVAGSVPGGPELDAELGWRVLARLAVLGAVGEGEIAAALAADPSAAGEEGAAGCRAALPDAAAKQAAWEALFSEEDALSNHLFTATVRGFWQPEQEEVLLPFEERYFAVAREVATRRGASIGAVVGRWGFPSRVADSVALGCAEALRGEGVPAALARAWGDALDDLRRALRVRELRG